MPWPKHETFPSKSSISLLMTGTVPADVKEAGLRKGSQQDRQEAQDAACVHACDYDRKARGNISTQGESQAPQGLFGGGGGERGSVEFDI